MYMDDGCYSPQNHERGSVRICTDNFAKEEVCLIGDFILEKWGIPFLVRKDYRGYYRLSLYQGAYVEKFLELIRPYVEPIKCMNRKLSREYDEAFGDLD